MNLSFFLILFILHVSNIKSELNDCKNGWIKLSDGRCFKLFPEKMSFFQARQKCIDINSQLATLEEADFPFIKQSLSGVKGAWIGLTDYGTEGKFRWVSGDTMSLDISKLTNDRDRDCGLFQDNSILKATECHYEMPYICMDGTKGTPLQSLELTNGRCPPKFFRSGRNCRYFSDSSTTFKRLDWFSAQTACRSMGKEADLLSILDIHDQDYFTALMSNSFWGMWIGLRYKEDAEYSNYRWARQQSVTFKNWLSKPTKTGCVMLSKAENTLGYWEEANCNTKLGYICESPLIPNSGDLKPEGSNPLLNQVRCAEGYIELQDVCYLHLVDSLPRTKQQAVSFCEKKHPDSRLVQGVSQGERALIRNLMRLQIKELNKVWVSLRLKSDNNTIISDSDIDPTQLNLSPATLDKLDKNKDKWSCFYVNQSRHVGYLPADCDTGAATPLCTYLLESHPEYSTNTTELFCPVGSSLYADKCFHFYGTAITAYDNTIFLKKEACQEVSLHSIHEERFLAKLIGDTAVWIGLNVQRNAGPNIMFGWNDGSNVNFLSLSPNSPSDGEKPYFDFNSTTYLWSNIKWDDKRASVCTKSAQIKCPEGYDLKDGTDCYKIVTKPLSWADAEKDCKDTNGNLASISHESMNKFIYSKIGDKAYISPDHNYWIGLSDLDSDQENMWNRWTDGQPFSYVNFDRKSQLNANGGEDCVVMQHTGTWNDRHCTENHPYVCVHHTRPLRRKPTSPDVAQIPIETEVGCPPDFTQFLQKCYRAVTEKPQSWTQANAYCKTLVPEKYPKRATLVRITKEAENMFVYSLLSVNHVKNVSAYLSFWIGMQVKKNEMYWIDNYPVTYSAIFRGAVKGRLNKCMTMVESNHTGTLGSWEPASCSQSLPFICQTPLLPTTELEQYANSHQKMKPPSHVQPQCPKGYVSYKGEKGLFCYNRMELLHSTSFDEARHHCASTPPLSEGSQTLLTLSSPHELAFLRSLFIEDGLSRDRAVWLGLKVSGEGEWLWDNGEEVDYTVWHKPPSNVTGCYAYRCPHPSHGDMPVGMTPVNCSAKLYMYCKYVPGLLTPPRIPQKNCFMHPKGSLYQGMTNITISNRSCIRWDLIEDIKSLPNLRQAFVSAGMTFAGAGNKCRNPNGIFQAPLCYVDRKGLYDYCPVPQCLASKSQINDYSNMKGTHFEHHSSASSIFVTMLVILFVVSIICLVGFCVWKRSAAGQGFIPYFRQSRPSANNSGGTSFHNPIYTPANC